MPEAGTAPVLIVGAGPVGLSLALGLARRNVRSIVIEKKAQPSEHSKAVIALTRTLEIFDEWGLQRELLDREVYIDEIAPCDREGNPVFKLHFNLLSSSSATPGVAVLPQHETERILLEACTASELVEIRYGSELLGLETRDDGVRARTGTPLGEEEIYCQFLCGCDGAHSSVREELGLKLEGKTYHAHAVLADVLIEDERDLASWPRVDFGAPGILAIVRFSPHYWRLITAYPGELTNEEPPPELVRKHVTNLLGPGPMKIVWSSGFRIHMRNAPHFRVGKILLLGDAAHLNSPAGGQGMNAGIQDAHNLAWKLDLILRGGDEEALLNSYDDERQDAIRHTVDKATDRLTRFGIFMSPVIRKVLLAGVAAAAKLPAVQKRIMRGLGMMNHRYDESALIHTSGGMYLPNVSLGDDLRLRDALGPWGGMLEIVNGQKVHLHDKVYDLSEAAAKELTAIGGPLIVMRPDHVVAYSGGSRSDAETVANLFKPPAGVSSSKSHV